MGCERLAARDRDVIDPRRRDAVHRKHFHDECQHHALGNRWRIFLAGGIQLSAYSTERLHPDHEHQHDADVCRAAIREQHRGKVEAVYLMDYKTFEDVTADLARFLDEVYNHQRLHARLSKPRAVRSALRPADGQNRSLILSGLRGALQNDVNFD
jgi:hypothetical protein